ncbi:double-strand break repair protein AddB [Meridianimarinicoccus sp. MJW13]|uniref:double-strand break repair protein AddB n=1 Tax=Meridianimarinicoccus sp. MJW13 TaxID=2720031 RepID=UPI001868C37D|nr:double-strand break repair protein AddB [Fluviibacterium sp. MJW13]
MTRRVAPGLYRVPPGVDFPAALVAGLRARYAGAPPEALARVTLYVNTRRMERRITALFTEGPPCLLPRIRLVAELGQTASTDLPPAIPPLRRRLELRQLVARLLEIEPDLAPDSAAFDLATSLTALLDEMQSEGVPLSAIESLDVTDQSGHWARSQKFIALAGQFLTPDAAGGIDKEARQRLIVDGLIRDWQRTPPLEPVLIAGSTGSRGTTARLMQAVVDLPQGAVVLPGVDPHMPPDLWRSLTDPVAQQDHPQYRFAALAEAFGHDPATIPDWADCPAPSESRNRLVSLALRPAPVTDGWRRDGPDLGDLRGATEGLTLIEAPDPRGEANALALCLRKAVEDGRIAALITPDRMLTRRVTAALARWGIEPDDSAGAPLRQTAPGRLIRHVTGLAGQKLTAEALLVLLKHPLVHDAADRGQHLLWTRELELHLRRKGHAFPDAETLTAWAETYGARRVREAEDVALWVGWICDTCLGHDSRGTMPLADHTVWLETLVTRLSLGPGAPDDVPAPVWDENAGEEARRVLTELAQEAEAGGTMDAGEFHILVNALLGGEVRSATRPDPRVMIWGTLEARVQGADLVVLAGLNDGSWPELPDPDPWLNRRMRAQAGLLLPERRIGLSAHDFQQAIAAPEAILSRARRDGEAETVPSRWLNRLTNLMAGLPDQNGAEALSAMRARGAVWVAMAAALDRPAAPVPAAPRPAPRPPLDHRPRELPVTMVETLIRDPYAVYARRILGLRRLDPLRATADMRDRGIVLHKVMEEVVPHLKSLPPATRRDAMMTAADRALAELPWPTARRLWRGRLARIADRFLTAEAARQADADPIPGECKGRLELPEARFTLTAQADRIDRVADGTLRIYDYKTGAPPTDKVQKAFAKQLLLEVAIAETAGFEDLPPTPVSRAVYLGLNAKLDESPAPLDDLPTAQVLTELAQLIAAYDDPTQGYTAQPAPKTITYESDYAHLSRRGEWEFSDMPEPEDVGW